MSYSYSFASSPPIGFTINPSTGLITIADTTVPYTGSISVQVSDGITTIVRAVSIVLANPEKTALTMQVSEGRVIGGGLVKIEFLDIISALAISGGIINIAFSGVNKNLSIASIGTLSATSTFAIDNSAPAPTSVEINGYVWMQAGESQTLTATAYGTRYYDINTDEYIVPIVDQGVTWSIIPGPFSSYTSIAIAGNECTVTTNNGSFVPGDAEVVIRATSTLNPSIFGDFIIWPIPRFDSIALNTNLDTIGAGQILTIGTSILGLGEIPSSALQNVGVTISENGPTSYYGAGFTNSSVRIAYTTSQYSGLISITARYTPYPGRNITIVGSKTVTNTG